MKLITRYYFEHKEVEIAFSHIRSFLFCEGVDTENNNEFIKLRFEITIDNAVTNNIKMNKEIAEAHLLAEAFKNGLVYIGR